MPSGMMNLAGCPTAFPPIPGKTGAAKGSRSVRALGAPFCPSNLRKVRGAPCTGDLRPVLEGTAWR